MADWKQIGAVKEVQELAYLMWDKNWDEANGGNITYLLTDEEVAELGYTPGAGRKVDLKVPDGVRGKYVLVTATGSYFRELRDDPDHLLGICYIPEEGDYYEIAYGLEDNRPTSEFPAHLATHAARLAVDPEQRVVMHNHATNVLAMTHVGPTDEKEFTLALWRIIPEAIVLFPEGIGLVPFMVCGTQDIADATLEKMKDRRFVVWQYHGVFSAGHSLHDAFGLLETVDKVAGVYLEMKRCGCDKQGIDDQGLRDLCEHFGLTPRAGYIEGM
ncbi:rhamnulose-1-phosphate aldolase [Olsenella sp. Marseille-QA0557]|uniref:Rhamnulose-1-phosphate aldolase n=1 Tax=Candidatus Coprovicinus avistercoris TaxID=2840754 RepID=A0A9D1L5U7_9ACTN|nr:rhamnulose-1-phosphate aldolase [Candidatus Coprovicinus avistercoris]